MPGVVMLSIINLNIIMHKNVLISRFGATTVNPMTFSITVKYTLSKATPWIFKKVCSSDATTLSMMTLNRKTLSIAR